MSEQFLNGTSAHFQVCMIFGKAYQRAASLYTAANRFRNAGVWPVDHDVFKDFDSAPTDVTFMEQVQTNSTNSDTVSSVPELMLTSDTPSTHDGNAFAEIVLLDKATSHSFASGTEIVNDTGATICLEYLTADAVQPGCSTESHIIPDLCM